MAMIRVPLEAAPAPPAPIGRWRALAGWFRACCARSRQRRELSLMSDEQLRDIGLSRAAVARECGRWPAPGCHRPELRLITSPPFPIVIRRIP